MNDRYLFKAKDYVTDEWRVGSLLVLDWDSYFVFIAETYESASILPVKELIYDHTHAVKKDTICQCTSLKDKNGTLIWENDILMCNNNPKDLAKAVFGEFSVIDADSLETVEKVVGWHYEVIPTDELSKCEPFCLSMPLTDFYIDMCDMKVCGSIFDNPELLEVER